MNTYDQQETENSTGDHSNIPNVVIDEKTKLNENAATIVSSMCDPHDQSVSVIAETGVNELYDIEVNDLVRILDDEPQMVEYVGNLMDQYDFAEYIAPEIMPEYVYKEVAVENITNKINQQSANDAEIDALMSDMFNVPTENVVDNNQSATDDSELDIILNDVFNIPIELNEFNEFQHDVPIEINNLNETQCSQNDDPSMDLMIEDHEQDQTQITMTDIFPDLYWNLD